MSFRKRSIGLGATQGENTTIRGVRPSPLDGRPTTSTGTQSLDALLAGHAGLAVGTSLLLEESGTTDFGGSLLRHYAAEGIVQGHHVHVLGMNEFWGRDLPALADESHGSERSSGSGEKMKIAWRYERLGDFGSGFRERTTLSSKGDDKKASIFCHKYDLTKRLALPSPSPLHYCPLLRLQPFQEQANSATTRSPFTTYLNYLMKQLSTSPNNTVHRVIIPSLLSPAIYPPHASHPSHVLQFLHGLRALLRTFPNQLTVLMTLPLTLIPRSSGLTRWMELLSDGVLELAPFPSAAIIPKGPNSKKSIDEEPPQGMLKIHRLPIFHEKGGGGGEASKFGDNFAFSLRRKEGLVIKPYSLPPVEEDTDAQQAGLVGEDGKEASKSDIEF